jgi:hypothetical protein
MVERYAVSGDATEIVDQLASLMAYPRLDRVVLSCQGGSMSLDDVLRMLEKSVLPKIGI